jgi:3-oxoadipate enol-lactonase
MRNVTLMRGRHVTSAEAFLLVDDARLRYRDEGRGIAVMLLHGWALDLDMWQPQVEAWSGRFRIVRFDRRGFGGSSGVPSIEADVRDVQNVAEHLGLERFALLGMSQAARVALLAAATSLRTRLTCLVLDGAPAVGGLQNDEAADEVPLALYRDLARREGLEAFRKAWRAHPFTQLHSADPTSRALLRRMTDRYAASDLFVPGEPLQSTQHPIPLESLQIAALVVNGELDTHQRRTMGAALCDALPQAEHAVIRASGHLPNLDNPRDYNAVVASFVARHAQPNRD